MLTFAVLVLAGSSLPFFPDNGGKLKYLFAFE